MFTIHQNGEIYIIHRA
uniref:Uncharacterized protein n=1 Tax=Anguilla anguilla TaxID=7936 RepID=A0A0E9SDH1_ANGAN